VDLVIKNPVSDTNITYIVGIKIKRFKDYTSIPTHFSPDIWILER